MNSPTFVLRELRTSDEAPFRAALAEFAEIEPDWPFAFHFDESATFSEYVERLQAWPRGESLPEKFVPNTFLVGVVGDRIVGRVSLRHQLNDFLKNFGGHIGYAVVPSARRRGYAKEMVRQTLPIARDRGIDRLLVTWDDTNIASQKVVEANCGILKRVVPRGEQPPMRSYWIDLIS